MDLAFPIPQDEPTEVGERLGVAAVALDVARNLGDPIRRVVAALKLCDPSLEIAPVPEVAISMHRDARAAKDDVRAAGQVGGVDAVTGAEGGERLAE